MVRNVYFVHDNGSAELHIDDSIVQVDAADIDLISGLQWTVGSHGYVTHGAGKDQILMHRLIMGDVGAMYVDHINRNKLDNRRVNLRVCSPAQNVMNREKQNNGSNPYKGICLSSDGKWQAQINLDGKAIYLGRFDTSVQAAKAYDTAARKLFGEYAFLNFPDATDKFSASVKRHSKLTKNEALSIRRLYSQGFSISEIADMYQHSYSSINRIVTGKTFQEDTAS